MVLQKIRNSEWAKGLAVFVSFSFLTDFLYPTNEAFALTGGPSQPEVQSFSPVGTSDMVNLSSGDFNYNIPLLDVGGYPINLSYNSGISADQEASWVGLGWNINPGVINRGKRGLPDDFDGDQVMHQFYMKPNQTFGANLGISGEIFGLEALNALFDAVGSAFSAEVSVGLGITYNNYNGVGLSQSLALSSNYKGLNSSLGLTASENGLTISPSLSYSKTMNKGKDGEVKSTKIGGSVGVGLNSRAGLTSVSVNAQASQYNQKSNKSRMVKGGATMNLTPNTYTPQINQATRNLNFSLNFKTGTTLFGTDPDIEISGFYSRQAQKDNGDEIFVPAYGYLNMQNSSQNSLLDFNREKEAGFTPATTNLPLTNFTYDSFSISGQGIGGMFRPFRSEIGHVFDKETISDGGDGNISLEAGGGGAADLGGDVTVMISDSRSGDWIKDNPAGEALQFQSTGSDPLYEPAYFKQAGELTVDSESDFFAQVGGFKSVAIPLVDAGGWKVKTVPEFRHKNSSGSYAVFNTGFSKQQRDERVKRNQHISTLNAGEVVNFGIGKYVNPAAENHHIAEVRVTRTDGARYIYGIAAYNTYQEEASFALSEKDILTDGDCVTGLVAYTPGSDDQPENGKGRDEFLAKTKTPPYAHSYLLTEVLSQDFVDLDGDGPDDDDFGTYTKFTYDKIDDYKWRVPYEANMANYTEGLKSDLSDEKGSFVYGEKDLFYLNMIETRTHVAVFHTSNRNDAKETAGVAGGSGSQSMKKLDKISLYAKGDWNANYDPGTPGDFSNLTPIKEVHFEYSYDLCQGIPNNATGQGKLTLERVFFTYEDSKKAQYNSYRFDYDAGNSASNPDYNLKGYDIWGCYKPNDIPGIGCGALDALTCPEFPYVDQDKTLADQYTAAWNIRKIELPSGGTINIEYESDDYAYVQDAEAMRMYKVVGATDADIPNISDVGQDELYEDVIISPDNYNKLIFEIDQAYSEAEFYNKFVKRLVDSYKGLIYFRFLLDIDNDTDVPKHDYVEGYGDIQTSPQNSIQKSYGTFASGGQNYGWITIAPSNRRDNDSGPLVNSISKAGWNFTRKHLPKLAFGLPDDFDNPDESASGIKNTIQTLAQASLINQITNFIQGPNGKLQNSKFCRTFVPEKSWIRLMEPTKQKLGGGCRVKRITMDDNWDQMTTFGTNFDYGQEYSYTKEDGTSSGVATYEPIQSKENPIVQAKFMTVKHLLVPDDEHYVEKPFGESFFPGPTVTYGRVTVKSLTRGDDVDGSGVIEDDEKLVTRNATGRVVHEFYTTFDYPTKVAQEKMQPIRKSLFSDFSLVKFFSQDFMNASQGYVVINNDMNGKPKAQWVYAENKDDPISGIQYLYGTNPTEQNYADGDPFTNTAVFSKPGELDNSCVVINKDGSVESKTVGVDFDIVADFRENDTENKQVGAEIGTNTFPVGPVPVVVPTVWPDFKYDRTRFRSAVVTKVINQYGILREVVAHDAGASVSTKNLAWDAQTGEVLVTSTQNEFADRIFTLNYPAHWAYDRMGQAYRNDGVVLGGLTGDLINGEVNVPDVEKYFAVGDEVIHIRLTAAGLPAPEPQTKGWVLRVDQGADEITLITKDGQLLGTGYPQVALKVIRSGRRNLQSLAAGSLTLKKNPIQPTGPGTFASMQTVIEAAGANARVLSAQAMEFSDDWRTFGSFPSDPGQGECVCEETETTSDFLNMLNDLGANHEEKMDGSVPPPIADVIDMSTVAGWGAFEGPVTDPDMLHAWFAGTDNWIWAFGFDPLDPDCTIQITGAGLSSSAAASTSFMVTDLEPIIEPAVCNSHEMTANFIFPIIGAPDLVVPVTISINCWSLYDCEIQTGSSDPVACATDVGEIINPFVLGVQGIWRPKRSHVFLGERDQQNTDLYASLPNKMLDLREDGQYTTFNPFWTAPTTAGADWDRDDNNWTWASQITNYTPFGQEVENQDRLYRSSGAVYGYNHSYSIAVANNAKYNQIAFDGFEDYDYFADQDGCTETRHFAFEDYEAFISEAHSHTGRRSMYVPPSGSFNTTRPLINTPLSDDPCNLTFPDDAPYTLKACDILHTFAPNTAWTPEEREFGFTSVRYVLSYWVKQAPDGPDPLYDFTACVPEILIGTTNLLGTPFKKSGIIDGWQKVEYYFSIANGTSGTLEVRFNNTGTTNIHVDDIRIHPFNSSIKTFVYDPLTLRLWAELDNNNYATIYEYDEEGMLLRIKKETERGVQTIQESRNSTVKAD